MALGGNLMPKRGHVNRDPRPEWICPECDGTNPGNYRTCGHFHPTKLRITGERALCATPQPGVPKLAAWKSMID